MSSSQPTLEDLEAAKAELARCEARWENYSGNNPQKHQTLLADARQRVRQITQALKASGDLLRSPHEELEAALDALHPNAQSRDIVEYQGDRYQRRFAPTRLSLSRKTVQDWERSWVKL